MTTPAQLAARIRRIFARPVQPLPEWRERAQAMQAAYAASKKANR